VLGNTKGEDGHIETKYTGAVADGAHSAASDAGIGQVAVPTLTGNAASRASSGLVELSPVGCDESSHSSKSQKRDIADAPLENEIAFGKICRES